MRGECMRCHVHNDHGFVVLPEHPAAATRPALKIRGTR
jgi:hypothetical protein